MLVHRPPVFIQVLSYLSNGSKVFRALGVISVWCVWCCGDPTSPGLCGLRGQVGFPQAGPRMSLSGGAASQASRESEYSPWLLIFGVAPHQSPLVGGAGLS